MTTSLQPRSLSTYDRVQRGKMVESLLRLMCVYMKEKKEPFVVSFFLSFFIPSPVPQVLLTGDAAAGVVAVAAAAALAEDLGDRVDDARHSATPVRFSHDGENDPPFFLSSFQSSPKVLFLKKKACKILTFYLVRCGRSRF